jgi:hypothetical protein
MMNSEHFHHLDPVAFYDKAFTYFLISVDISTFMVVAFDTAISPKEKRAKASIDFLINVNTLFRNKKDFNLFK